MIMLGIVAWSFISLSVCDCSVPPISKITLLKVCVCLERGVVLSPTGQIIPVCQGGAEKAINHHVGLCVVVSRKALI